MALEPSRFVEPCGWPRYEADKVRHPSMIDVERYDMTGVFGSWCDDLSFAFGLDEFPDLFICRIYPSASECFIKYRLSGCAEVIPDFLKSLHLKSDWVCFV